MLGNIIKETVKISSYYLLFAILSYLIYGELSKVITIPGKKIIAFVIFLIATFLASALIEIIIYFVAESIKEGIFDKVKEEIKSTTSDYIDFDNGTDLYIKLHIHIGQIIFGLLVLTYILKLIGFLRKVF